MRLFRDYGIYILLLLGFLSGCAFAVVMDSGLLATWHFVGNPGEKIARIIGIKNYSSVLVTTVPGNTYSFKYLPYEYPYPSPYLGEPDLSNAIWLEEDHSIVPHNPQNYGANFIARPPPFKVSQVYELDYVFESGYMTKIALSQDGNLWIWHYESGGFGSMMRVVLFPIFGLLIGAILGLLVLALRWKSTITKKV